MASRKLADYAASQEPVLKLPHPYLTAYHVQQGESLTSFLLKAQPAVTSSEAEHEIDTSFISLTEPEDLKSGDRPPDTNNTSWARARRSPQVTVQLKQSSSPALSALWLLTYVIFTIRPTEESFRLELTGSDSDLLSSQLKAVALAIDHPKESSTSDVPDELLVLRGNFWQGAGSPFGPRPIWVLEPASSPIQTSSYPLTPLSYTLTNNPGTPLSWHPRRPVKPTPGSLIYSRYIPHLRETFSMIALDYQDRKHVELFHHWQNDPRVSQGWNLTGTLGQHKEYLRQAHEDPHRISILARFEEAEFAYFEVYWAKENRLGPYYPAISDFDRGRHSLVGDVRYRGPHRVSAWWSSLMHYLFLDDSRTMNAVGEPRYTNSSVLMYDLMHGFGLDKMVDLPDKRAAFMRCSRERFFQLCHFGDDEDGSGRGRGKVVGGTGVGLVPKL